MGPDDTLQCDGRQWGEQFIDVIQSHCFVFLRSVHGKGSKLWPAPSHGNPPTSSRIEAMRASRSYPRSLLVILLVAGCAAAAIAPVLVPVQAAPVRAPVRAPLDHIVISEFRTDIPNGLSPLTNSFIELFNPTGGPLTIGAGWKLERSNCAGTTGTIYTFPAPVVLRRTALFDRRAQLTAGVWLLMFQ